MNTWLLNLIPSIYWNRNNPLRGEMRIGLSILDRNSYTGVIWL